MTQSGIFILAWKQALRPRLQHLSLRDLERMLAQLKLKLNQLQPRLLSPLLSNHDLTWMPIFSWLRFYNFLKFSFFFYKASNLFN